MKDFQVAYIPIGVPTFHLESARVEFEHSVSLLCSISESVITPQDMLLSIGDLQSFLDSIDPSIIILQNITFANAAYTAQVMRQFDCPVVLWTLREPVVDGGRLRLNSLTGAYSAANCLHELGRDNFQYVLGAPTEQQTKDALCAAINAARVKQDMGRLKMSAVGHTPQGFGFGRALDSDLLRVFGVTLEAIEARELIDRAKGYTDGECLDFLEATRSATIGLELTPDKNLMDHARLYKAYSDYITENNIGALASRCWPDFFTAYGTPVCTVLSMLNDNGTAASCEADIYGALSMYIGMKLTGSSVFFGDPVSLDEGQNTVTYWHCGMAACSLASGATGACVGVHPNRKIGPAMDFGCRGGERVTVFRIGRKPDGSFRFFIAGGAALDVPKQFTGTSVVVNIDTDVRKLVVNSVKAGWEPHFAVIYGDVVAELRALAEMLRIEIWE